MSNEVDAIYQNTCSRSIATETEEVPYKR
uniref:Uncharacterized protein n=1 Tax=Nelumbo nucifera TaxID=4432 RepID=A0A822ZT93_NELNU|nr:TPA_asm: hypothetical protein HUJ06_016522 [Nelumbo nucifera]